MENSVVEKVEAAAKRFEFLSIAAGSEASDPAILAFDKLALESLSRVSVAAEKIGGKVLEALKLLEESFSVERGLLIKARHQFQVENELPQHFVHSFNQGHTVLSPTSQFDRFKQPLNQIVTGDNKVASNAQLIERSQQEEQGSHGPDGLPGAKKNIRIIDGLRRRNEAHALKIQKISLKLPHKQIANEDKFRRKAQLVKRSKQEEHGSYDPDGLPGAKKKRRRFISGVDLRNEAHEKKIAKLRLIYLDDEDKLRDCIKAAGGCTSGLLHHQHERGYPIRKLHPKIAERGYPRLHHQT